MRNFGLDQRNEAPEPMRTQPTFAASTQPAAQTERKAAVLGATLRFKGELSAEEDLILQGRIEGSINHTQSMTVGTEGSVLGNIQARTITIDGSVEGDLHGSESVVVHATGRVVGNIFAPRIGIVEGAFFSGRIEMPDKPANHGRSGGVLADRPAGVPLSAEETEKLLGAKPSI
jgi:cytoskeletal protein CcmA (bactofilin family)